MTIKQWKKSNTTDLSNKTIVVTGALTGLGKELVKHLLSLHANVVMAVHNEDLGRKLKNKLARKYLTGNKINVMKLDLLSIGRVNEFIDRLTTEYPDGVDGFVNNAGIYAHPHKVLDCGYEKHFFTNFLSPYYMTRKLLAYLNKKECSVVFVSSISYKYTEIDFDNIDFREEKKHSHIYGNSKRWLAFVVQELKSVCKTEYQNLKINLVHPGITPTNLMHYKNGTFNRFQYWYIKTHMSLIYMLPKKASLCELMGLIWTTEPYEWIGPEKQDIWGYPTISKMEIDAQKSRECYEKANEMIEKLG